LKRIEVLAMNNRLSRIVSRLSLLSVVSVAALGAVACSNASPTTASQSAEAQQAQAAPRDRSLGARGPAYRVFREIEALDLRDDQQVAIAEIEETLNLEMAPHRETLRQVAKTLATGVEEGTLDAKEAAAQQAALEAVVADAKLSVSTAVNAVHDTLDTTQREELVAKLKELRERHHGRADREGREDAPLSKIHAAIGLSDDQKQALREAFRSGVEELFPDRKAAREAQEAKMKALAEAFLRDDFDAGDFDLGSGAEEGVKSFTEVANRAIAVSGKVLSRGQRSLLAELVRERAGKI
jgi:Spy/CpxP family protein refolding chaperone